MEQGRAVEAVLDVGSGQARVMGKLDETAVFAKERKCHKPTSQPVPTKYLIALLASFRTERIPFQTQELEFWSLRQGLVVNNFYIGRCWIGLRGERPRLVRRRCLEWSGYGIHNTGLS